MLGVRKKFSMQKNEISDISRIDEESSADEGGEINNIEESKNNVVRLN